MHSVSYICIFPCTFNSRCSLTLSLVEGNHPGGDGSSGSVGLGDVSLAKAEMLVVVLGWFGVGLNICGLGCPRWLGILRVGFACRLPVVVL